MLPKKFRLNAAEFYRNPQRSQKFNSHFGTLYLKLANITTTRFAIVVSSSLDKRAVYRNRTKRIIIEAIRKYLSNFTQKGEVLIRAERILKKTDRLLIEKEVYGLFKKAGLL